MTNETETARPLNLKKNYSFNVGDIAVDVDFSHTRRISFKERVTILSDIERMLELRPCGKTTSATIKVHTNLQGKLTHYEVYYHLSGKGLKGPSEYHNMYY